MYGHAIRRGGPTNTLLEWDARIPPFEEVHAEALKAKKFLDKLAAGADYETAERSALKEGMEAYATATA